MSRSSFLEYLGDIEEDLQGSYSSEILFNSVDHCLYQALRCVLSSSFLAEDLLTYLRLTGSNKILYKLDKDQYNLWMYKFFNAKSTASKLKILEQIKINRELLCFIIEVYLNNTKALPTQFINSDKLATPLKLRSRSDAKHVTNHERCIHWYKTFIKMREGITQKYYRQIRVHTSKMPYKLKDTLDSNDVSKELYLNLIKAFHRYDIASGTFTSFVEHWFKNGKSRSIEKYELGTAFSVTTSERLKIAKGKSKVVNYSGEVTEATVAGESNFRDVYEFLTEDVMLILDMIDSDTYFYRLINDYEFDMSKVFNLSFDTVN